MLHLPQMGLFEMLITLLPFIQNSRQFSLLELFTLLRPCFFRRSHTYQHYVFLFGLLQLVYLHCLNWPILSLSTNASLPPHPRLQTSHPPSTHFVSPTMHPFFPAMFLVVFLYLVLPLPLTCSIFFNTMLEVSEPGAVNYNTLARLILLTLPVSRNPTLTQLPLYGSQNSLLCNLIAFTPSLTFFLPMTRASTSSFSELSSPLFLR